MNLGIRVEPIVLRGESVRLEPLGQEHAQGLYNRGRTAGDWNYMPRSCFIDMADVRQWIGATREGVMRNHMIVQGNFVRDSVYFSVIDSDWPEVKERLTQLREHARA